MNDLKVFENSEFGKLEILLIDGKEYFPATACAKKLGYVKPHNAITMHCRYPLKWGVPHPQNPDKAIEKNFIPEGDLYRLIINSKLPAAERFERWVFDVVLPAIRSTGGYMSEQLCKDLSDLRKYQKMLEREYETETMCEVGCKINRENYYRALAMRKETRGKIKLLQKLVGITVDIIDCRQKAEGVVKCDTPTKERHQDVQKEELLPICARKEDIAK